MSTLKNAKNGKTVLRHPEHYGKTRLIKIAGGNLAYSEDILVTPH